MGSDCLMDTEFQFYKMKSVIRIRGGDGCTTISMYLTPLNCTFKNGKMCISQHVCFTTKKKKTRNKH